MQRHYDVLVVGTGPAGTQVALGLAAVGYTGSIGLIGAEPELPYDRPPLSKAYLTGDLTDDALLIRPRAFWDERPIDLVLGTVVVAVDAVARRVETADGLHLSYGSLVWAAGCRARTLSVPGSDLNGVQSLRTWSDARELRTRLSADNRIVVIGGGYIGLEVAAAASKLGAQVTVIEAQDRLLARVTGNTVAEFVARRHVAAGVRLMTGRTVEALTGDDHVTGVRLDTGEAVEADTVLVGVGVVPNVEPLVEAGAECSDGMLVDRDCRTSLANVFAAGDCARVDDASAPSRGFRIESIPNAAAHARAVVAALTGQNAPDQDTPWFWSNQYEMRLKTAGLVSGYDGFVVRGDPDKNRFAVIYTNSGKVIAVDTVNSPRDFAQGKGLVGLDVSTDHELLADVSIPLTRTPADARSA